MGSVKVTSFWYHESNIGSKNEVYSLVKTRFSFVTVAAISSSSAVAVDVDAAAASVVDKSCCWVARCCCVEDDEGEQNASAAGQAARRNSSEPRSDNIADCLVMTIFCCRGVVQKYDSCISVLT